jgi:opacity protein-like surface antigen
MSRNIKYIKMKKITSFKLIVIFVISLFTTNLFAQSGYVSFNLGYGLGTSSQNIGIYNYTSTTISGTNPSSSINKEQVNVSLGQGANIGCTFGYMFTKNVGAELGISYFIGGSSTMQEVTTSIAGSSKISSTTDYSFSANMLRFNPSVVLITELEGINPYAKFGFLIGTGSITEEKSITSSGILAFTKTKLNGGMAFGFTASVGAMYNLSKNISLFGELAMINMSYAPIKGEITEATLNSTNLLSNMTAKEKLTDYVDSYNTSVSIPNSKPKQELKEKYPFGSFTINVGIKIGF